MDVWEIIGTVVAILVAGGIAAFFRSLITRLPPMDVFLSHYRGNAEIRTADGEQLRSKHSHTQTEIEFENRLAEPVDIYWINYEGGREKYYTLRPGETRRQQTFVTHPWIIETVSDGTEVHRIIVDVSIGRVIVEPTPVSVRPGEVLLGSLTASAEVTAVSLPRPWRNPIKRWKWKRTGSTDHP